MVVSGDEGDHAAARRHELAEFLRVRRDEIQPEDVGLKRQGRRRVKGLRRHEVADLAAVSLTWYTWMEQGRPIRTSPSVLDAIAHALKLDDDGRQHLRRLGGVAVEAFQGVKEPDPSLVGIVDDLLPAPAYLITPANDLVAWNTAYSRLFADPTTCKNNALWMMLFSEDCRAHIVDWERETIEIIAAFRAEAAKFPADGRINELVEELTGLSPLFREAWEGHHVRRFQPHVQQVQHRDVGLVSTQLLQLRPLDQPSLLLRIHRPADDESRERLRSLLVDK